MGLAGFELSIDDFGTQFSNIEQLLKFPFKELKIDQSFVLSASTNDRARATVQSCVSLGRELGLRVVAEGIETQEDWDCVARLGVDVIQGYHAAKPMPVSEINSWATGYRTAKEHNRVSGCP